MKIVWLFIFLSVHNLCVNAQKDKQLVDQDVVELTSDTIYWNIPKLNLSNVLLFSNLDTMGFFNNDVQKGSGYSFFINAGSFKKEYITTNVRKQVYHIVFKKGKLSKQLNLIFWCDVSSGEFDLQFINTYSGKLLFETPEMYELACVALSLAIDQGDASAPLHYQSEYYKEVQAYFLPFKNNPLIQAIKKHLSNAGIYAFYSLCTDSYGFNLDSGKTIQQAKQYHDLGSRTSLWDDIQLWQGFIDASGFRKFYKDHSPFYNKQLEDVKKRLSFSDAWKWMDTRFGKTPGDYRFVLSPLINAFFNSLNLTDNNYSEVIFFAPQFISSNYRNRNDNAANLLYLSNFFLNAIKLKIELPLNNYRQDVEKMFSDFDIWADPDKEAFNQPNGVSLFMEYFSEALYLLYVKQTDYESFKVIKDFRDRRIKQKGYIKFDSFFNALVNISDKNVNYEKWIPTLITDLKQNVH